MLSRLRKRLLAAAQGREIAMARAREHGRSAPEVVAAELARADAGTLLHASLRSAANELEGMRDMIDDHLNNASEDHAPSAGPIGP